MSEYTKTQKRQILKRAAEIVLDEKVEGTCYAIRMATSQLDMFNIQKRAQLLDQYAGFFGKSRDIYWFSTSTSMFEIDPTYKDPRALLLLLFRESLK